MKLDTFEKTLGGNILHNQLSRLDVDDEYNFDLEKDSKSLSLLVLKGLINSYFVWKNSRDCDNLKYKLKRIRLQLYFPQGKVVKEGFDIYDMVCEILPGNTVANLRSNLCGFLHNIEYFSALFCEEFAPKEYNIYYIGKQIWASTVPNHNAIFALCKMLKQSMFIVRF